MKTIHCLYCLLMMSLFLSNVSAQTYSEENYEESDLELVKSNTMNVNIFKALGINNQPDSRNLIISGNSINLRQIGDFNQAKINVATNDSEIKLTQNGNYNLTQLEYKANTAVADLTQNGDNNVIKDYVYNPNANIFLDLQQDGDNLTFERFGSNNLTKSLQFRQTEASPTIIIRSFQ